MIASRAVGSDAVVEVLRGLSTGRIDEAEFSELWRHLWRSTADSKVRKPWSGQNYSDDTLRQLHHYVSLRSRTCYQTTAILRLGSFK